MVPLQSALAHRGSLLKNAIQNLFSKFFGKPQSAPVTRALPTAKPKLEPATLSTDKGDTDSSLAISLGAHRPLISTGGKVIGFEFHLNTKLLERLSLRADPMAQAAYASVLLTSARLVAKTGRIGMARVPAQWLALVVTAETTPGMMIATEATPSGALDSQTQAALPEIIALMRTGGAKFGWTSDLQLACDRDFVMVCQGAEPIAEQFKQMQTWPLALQALPVFATDLSNLEDIEIAMDHQIAFVCGELTGQCAPSRKTDLLPLPPAARHLGQLVTQLVGRTETLAIVNEIKSDVGLSYRLLQRMNAANFAQNQPTGSIEHAVMLLGRTELYRWLSILLLQFSGKSRAGSALQEVTLWRSRNMELLAKQRQEPPPEDLFMLGLASMLGALLNISPEDACDTLSVSDQAREALLAHTGPWQDYLEITSQLEHNDLQEESALVQSFGGAAQIMELSAAAWAWAEANNDRNRAPSG